MGSNTNWLSGALNPANSEEALLWGGRMTQPGFRSSALGALWGTKVGDHLDHFLKVAFVVQIYTQLGSRDTVKNKERPHRSLNRDASKAAPLWGGRMTPPEQKLGLVWPRGYYGGGPPHQGHSLKAGVVGRAAASVCSRCSAMPHST